jgi:hypothetical protein
VPRPADGQRARSAARDGLTRTPVAAVCGFDPSGFWFSCNRPA